VSAPWAQGDPDAVARTILAEPRFHAVSEGPPPKSLLDIIFDKLAELWRALTKPLGHLVGNPTLTTVLGFTVLALALLFLAVVVWRFTRASARRRVVAERAASVALAPDGNARALRDRALAAAAAGRYREAAGLLWASALRALDERGRVRFDAARTPGEWRRAVRDPDFDALARDAVTALFAERGVDAALVERMRAEYDAVVGRA
jgi:cbb3-type cytochrome oxidase subunit 3